jgi:hypothetical protein
MLEFTDRFSLLRCRGAGKENIECRTDDAAGIDSRVAADLYVASRICSKVRRRYRRNGCSKIYVRFRTCCLIRPDRTPRLSSYRDRLLRGDL